MATSYGRMHALNISSIARLLAMQSDYYDYSGYATLFDTSLYWTLFTANKSLLFGFEECI